MFTLNNISSLFREFVTKHYNLGNNLSDADTHYYFGVAGEHENKQGGVKYPMLVAELQTSTIAEKLETYDFKIWVMSQHKLYEGREDEQLSDLKLIATDFCIWLFQTKFAANKSVTIDPNITFTDFSPSFNDLTCGWFFTIKIKQFLDWDLCRIPMTGAPGPDPSGGVKIYDQHGNLLFTKYPGEMLVVNDLTTVTETYTVTGTTQVVAHTPLVVYSVTMNGQFITEWTLVGSTFTFTNAMASDKIDITYAY